MGSSSVRKFPGATLRPKILAGIFFVALCVFSPMPQRRFRQEWIAVCHKVRKNRVNDGNLVIPYKIVN
jgi:hypothetical protein